MPMNRILAAVIAVTVLAGGEPVSHSTDTLDEVRQAVSSGAALIVDVRERAEWEAGHLAKARLLPLSTLRADGPPADLAKDRPIYVHCRSGRRCLEATQLLRRAGYDARALKPGFEELQTAGVGTAAPATP